MAKLMLMGSGIAFCEAFHLYNHNNKFPEIHLTWLPYPQYMIYLGIGVLIWIITEAYLRTAH